MKKTVLMILLVFLAVFAVTAAGCISPDEAGDPIVGNWTTSPGNIPVVINDDGTGSMMLTIFGFSKEYPLTWETVEGFSNKYLVTATEPEIPLGMVTIPMGEYTISDDGKTLIGPTALNNPLTLQKKA